MDEANYESRIPHQNKKEQANTCKRNETKRHRDRRKVNDSQEQTEKDSTVLNKTIHEHNYSTTQKTPSEITSAQENQTKAHYPTGTNTQKQPTINGNTSGEETDHYGKLEGETNEGRYRHNNTNKNVEHHATEKDESKTTKNYTKSDSELDHNTNRGYQKRKTTRERNALHSITWRGKRELTYKFTNNVNKTKPSKAPPTTNNLINNNNRETPTIKHTTTNRKHNRRHKHTEPSNKHCKHHNHRQHNTDRNTCKR